MKRCKARNPSGPLGSAYTFKDFRIGISIEINAIVYRIYACDEFTDYFYRESNIDVGDFEQPPDDLYSVKRKLTDRPIRISSPNSDKTHLRQFLDYDGKVLRFYTIWDDRKSAFGELRKFVLLYFLVDNKFEVRQVLPPNCGRDPVQRMVSKTSLSYTDKDLRIGNTIRVFDRDFLIYDADDFTKSFIDNKYGPQNWDPIPLEESKRRQRLQQPAPPYNGFGSEEDSLGYCTSLHPKPPRKNLVQLLNKEGQVIRFGAKLINPKPQDKDREFIFAYFMNDDTLAISERRQRNSGFVAGKFLNKGRYKNPQTGELFHFEEFYVGAIVIVNNFQFQLYEADEYAFNYMEADADNFVVSDLFNIVSALKTNQNIEYLRKSF